MGLSKQSQDYNDFTEDKWLDQKTTAKWRQE
jgi:hypothetical protein